MASRMVLVDDMDSGIQYVGPWFESHGSQDKSGTFGLPIRSTLHGVTQNAGLSYAFSGSYVALQGTCDVEKVDGVLNPSWECFVDGVSIGYKEPHFFLEDRCTLCETEHLDDRPHVITVNTTVRNNKIFWFDDVSYIPSASVALDQALVYIESSDSSIQYGAGWRGVRDIAYMTSEAGSKLTFEFTGASISWYGFIPNDMPLASTSATYSIDGETPVRFLLNGLLPATQDRYNQLFFQSPQLPPGHHTLVVVHEGDTQKTPLVLDYLIVQNGTSGGSSTSGTTNGLPTPSARSNSSRSPGKAPVKEVIGGVIAGLVVMIIAVFLVIRWSDRRRDSRIREQRLSHASPDITLPSADHHVTGTTNVEESQSMSYYFPPQRTHTDPTLTV